MRAIQRNRALLWLALALPLGAGCGGGGDAGGPIVDNTVRGPLIEEPDIYRRDGDTLYVQNRDTGLNVIDVADPAAPRLLGRAPLAPGAGAELYARAGGQVIVLLKTAVGCAPLAGLDAPGWKSAGQVAFVDASSRAAPKLLGQHCTAGEIVASRTVDNVLYVVTSDGADSLAASLDVTDPARPRVVDTERFAGASKEIFLTADTLMVATRWGTAETRVQYVALAKAGEMTVRGSVFVPGRPQGRFHMDLRGRQFRIVTFDDGRRASVLTLVDFTDADKPATLGGLSAIAPGEQLYATRFDGDLAYVVTFRRTDPLWVISLADPASPEIVGELQVPGWSDYLFPRGDRLIAVGRGGGRGLTVGMSLFDVSEPAHPRVLKQIELGTAASASEANIDHRGISILEGLAGSDAVVALGISNLSWSRDDAERTVCRVQNELQLVDVTRSTLAARGKVAQQGGVRRSFLVENRLYSLSDFELHALDVSDRDRPRPSATLRLGTEEGLRASNLEVCTESQANLWFGCRAAGRAALPSMAPIAIALLALVLQCSKQRRRRAARPAALVAALFALAVADARADEPQEVCPDGEACGPEAVRTTTPAQPAPYPSPAPAPGETPLPPYQPSLTPDPPLAPVAVTYRRERRTDLALVGGLVFAGIYVWNAAAAYFAAEWRLALPGVGPLVYLAHYRSRFDCSQQPLDAVLFCRAENDGDRMVYGWLALDAAVQLTGLTLLAVGLFTHRRIPIAYGATIVPSLRPSFAGLTLAGTF